MKNLIKSITHHVSDTSIFVLAVSLAAVAHSSWTFSTILGGDEPPDLGERIPWILIGLFLAFSLDIGLLALSGEIRHGKRSAGRFVAFLVLAAAMAYLQTVFCLTHAPVLTLSKAVRAEWIGSAQLILDLAVFITPGLLPVAIVLHTFSGEQAQEQTAEPSTALPLVAHGPLVPVAIADDGKIEIECTVPGCEWAGSYSDQRGAQNALSAHSKKHEKERVEVLDQALDRVEELEARDGATADHPALLSRNGNGRH